MNNQEFQSLLENANLTKQLEVPPHISPNQIGTLIEMICAETLAGLTHINFKNRSVVCARHFGQLVWAIENDRLPSLTGIWFRNCSGVTDEHFGRFVEAIHNEQLTGLKEVYFHNCSGVNDTHFGRFVDAIHNEQLTDLTTLSFGNCSGVNDTHFGRFVEAIHNEQLTDLTTLSFGNCSGVTDEHFGRFVEAIHKRKLTGLTALGFSNCSGVTDEHFGRFVNAIHERKLTSLTALDFSNCEEGVTERHFAAFAQAVGDGKLPRLHVVYLSGCAQISDAGLKHLAGLTNLTTLDLSGCKQISDAGLKHLAGLTNLTTLDLSRCKQISDAGLKHLAGLTNLTTLYLGWCKQISDAGLKHLAGLTNLTTLYLSGCEQISDAGLKHLAGLTNLTTLYLSGCEQISDAGLKHLAGLTNLTTLDLGWCEQISDAGLKHLAGLTNLTTLYLSGCEQISDAGLKHLAGLTNLTTLYLSGCEQISDAGLKHLAGLTNLTTLDLGWCEQISDAGLKHLAGLTNLTTLDLSRCKQISDAGLKHLAGLTNLTTLYLSGCEQISDAGLKHLAGLTNLTTLYLSGCEQISDAGLKHLAGLTNLTTLDLSGCAQISDAGLKHLAGLTNLTTLHLSGCEQISDAGLKHLAGLTNLTTLDLSRCKQISDAGLDRLARLPSLSQVYLTETSITAVAEATLQTGNTKQIFDAFRRGRLLHRVKICLVGMGEVGKSSLCWPLFLGRPTTEGDRPDTTKEIDFLLEVDNFAWQPRATMPETGENVTFVPAVWDFGGQWIKHAVHERFLNPDSRAIYILVLAADRLPQSALQEGFNDNKEGNRLDYWLGVLARYVATPTVKPPAVVAISQCDRYRGKNDGRKRPIDEPLNEGGDEKLIDYTDEAWRLGNRAQVDGEVAIAVQSVVNGLSATDTWPESAEATPEIQYLRTVIEQTIGSMESLWTARVGPLLPGVIDRVEEHWRKHRLVTREKIKEWLTAEAEKLKSDDDDPFVINADATLDELRSLGVVVYLGQTKADLARLKQPEDGELDRRSLAERYEWIESVAKQSHLQKYAFNPRWLMRPLYEVVESACANDEWRWPQASLERFIADRVDKVTAPKDGWQDKEKPETLVECVTQGLLQLGLCCHEPVLGTAKPPLIFPGGLPEHPPFELASALTSGVIHARWTWPVLRRDAVHRLMVDYFSRDQIISMPDGRRKWWRFGAVLDIEGCEVTIVRDEEVENQPLDVYIVRSEQGRPEVAYEILREQLRKLAGTDPEVVLEPNWHSTPPASVDTLPATGRAGDIVAVQYSPSGQDSFVSSESSSLDGKRLRQECFNVLAKWHGYSGSRGPNQPGEVSQNLNKPLKNLEIADSIGVRPPKVSEVWKEWFPKDDRKNKHSLYAAAVKCGKEVLAAFFHRVYYEEFSSDYHGKGPKENQGGDLSGY